MPRYWKGLLFHADGQAHLPLSLQRLLALSVVLVAAYPVIGKLYGFAGSLQAILPNRQNFPASWSHRSESGTTNQSLLRAQLVYDCWWNEFDDFTFFRYENQIQRLTPELIFMIFKVKYVGLVPPIDTVLQPVGECDRARLLLYFRHIMRQTELLVQKSTQMAVIVIRRDHFDKIVVGRSVF